MKTLTFNNDTAIYAGGHLFTLLYSSIDHTYLLTLRQLIFINSSVLACQQQL